MRYTNPQLRTLLSGEYALGVLAPSVNRRFQRLLLTDNALRDEVLFWEQHLAQWAANLKPQQPDDHVWRRIAATLDQNLTASKQPSATFWRWGTGLAVAASLMLAVALFSYTPPPVAPTFSPTHVAVFSETPGQPVWVMEANMKTGEIHMRALAGAAPATDKSYELWMLPATGKPVSLGLMPTHGMDAHTMPALLVARMADAKGLAVSLEPRGGSPTGSPTGPVVYTASLISS